MTTYFHRWSLLLYLIRTPVVFNNFSIYLNAYRITSIPEAIINNPKNITKTLTIIGIGLFLERSLLVYDEKASSIRIIGIGPKYIIFILFLLNSTYVISLEITIQIYILQGIY